MPPGAGTRATSGTIRQRTNVWIGTRTTCQKYRNVTRDPRVALVIQDPDDQLRYLELRGRVTGIHPDSASPTLARPGGRQGALRARHAFTRAGSGRKADLTREGFQRTIEAGIGDHDVRRDPWHIGSRLLLAYACRSVPHSLPIPA